MKTLYFDCGMGAAGDMLMAALLELHPDPDGFLARMNALGIPGVEIRRSDSIKCGIKGTHVRVTVHGQEEESQDVHGHDHHPRTHDHHHDHIYHAHDHNHDHHHNHDHAHDHQHRGLSEIRSLIQSLNLPEKVKGDAIYVYARIAEAEAHVHGRPIDQVHFHEVGSLDAVADVVGVCLLIHELGAEKIAASAIHVGYGQVKCAHGILPVPAPATARILTGIPTYGEIRGELCTPTGAALIAHFAREFGPMPAMAVEKIGYGMGTKDFTAANCVRAMLGESTVKAASPEGPNGSIVQLECNLDDMTGEAVGFAVDRLFEAGAKDVFLQSIQMKKNRPGQLLCCICMPEDADRLAALMLRHTTTLGVRRQDMSRYTLTRRVEARETPLGPVHYKVSEGYGVQREKPEYADLERIALEKGMTLEEILKQLR